MIGKHLIKGWSKTQALIALSSAESELYAVLRTASETLGLISMGTDMQYQFGGKIWGDASVALGIIHRRGLGRTRHIDTSLLWVQQVAAEKRLAFAKVLGKDNPADLFTKHLDSRTSDKHVNRVNCEYIGGRSSIMPGLHKMSISWHEYLQSRDAQDVLALEKKASDILGIIMSGHSRREKPKQLSLRNRTCRSTHYRLSDECLQLRAKAMAQKQTLDDHEHNYYYNSIYHNHNSPIMRYSHVAERATRQSHCAIRYNQGALKVTTGRDWHPHDNSETCIASSQLDQILFSKMYRGSMSVGPNFSHCLGATSEGGFRDIHGLCTY